MTPCQPIDFESRNWLWEAFEFYPSERPVGVLESPSSQVLDDLCSEYFAPRRGGTQSSSLNDRFSEIVRTFSGDLASAQSYSKTEGIAVSDIVAVDVTLHRYGA